MEPCRRSFRAPGIALIVSLGSLGATAPGPANAQQGAQAELIEEVIVTGSFIRRESFDTSSPLDVMTQMDLVEQGRPNLADIVRNSTYNFGVNNISNVVGASAQSGALPGANFRGLGTGATLTLLDGRRTLTQNLVNLYPQILIDRVENLTDGGAAIYGTDAVGGVMNLIPRRHFEGVEVNVAYNSDTRGDWDEVAWSAIGGIGTDRSRMVAALEFRDRGELQFFDRKMFTLGGASVNTQSSPGEFGVPVRDASGEIVGEQIQADPGCGFNNAAAPEEGRSSPLAFLGFPGFVAPDKEQGFLGQRQGQFIPAIPGLLENEMCIIEFGDMFNFSSDLDTFVGTVLFDHQLTDHISFEAELLFNRTENEDRGPPGFPGGQVQRLATVPGEHPGNPFRAMNAADQPLFARPANPDDPQDFQPARDDDDNVILADNQFASLEDDPDGGVPFNEDVQVNSLIPIGFSFTQPTRSNEDGTGPGPLDFVTTNFRWVGQLRFHIPNTTWSGHFSHTFHRQDSLANAGSSGVESLQALNAGLTGQLPLGLDEETGEERFGWFNPFSTQNFICVDRDCRGGERQPEMIEDPETGEMVPNPAVNSTQVFDMIAKLEPIDTETKLNVSELVFTGEVLELPAGPIGVALGTQWRRTDIEETPGPTFTAQDAFVGGGRRGFDEKRDVFAGFAEVEVPVAERIRIPFVERIPHFGRWDLSAAVRRENVDDNADADLNSTDFKIGLRWEVRDFLALRASWGTSFITPSLTQLFQGQSTTLANVTDPFGGELGFISRTAGGNPNVEPEEAEIWNFGLSLRLLDGDLSANFDWKYFDFDDRIIRPLPSEIVRDDAQNAAEFLNKSIDDLTRDDLFEWLENGTPNPDVVRDSAGVVRLVNTPLINAQSMEWKGFDFEISYRFNSSQLPFTQADFGRFSAGVNATYVQSFAFRTRDDAEKIEGAGRRNLGFTAVPPSPRWRGNLRLGWTLDRHSVVITGRYTHNLRGASDGSQFCDGPFRDFLPLFQITNGCPDKISAHMEWDLRYSVDLDGLIWGDRRTNVSLGLINAFDNKPDAISTRGGLETQIHDPRLRMFHVRLSQEL